MLVGLVAGLLVVRPAVARELLLLTVAVVLLAYVLLVVVVSNVLGLFQVGMHQDVAAVLSFGVDIVEFVQKRSKLV